MKIGVLDVVEKNNWGLYLVLVKNTIFTAFFQRFFYWGKCAVLLDLRGFFLYNR